MERGRIVDPVAQVADHVAGLAERREDPLLLVRLGLREDVYLAHALHQRGVAQAVQILAGTHGRPRNPHLASHPAGDETVVPGDDLQFYAELPEFGDGLERARLRRIFEQQESMKVICCSSSLEMTGSRSRPGPRRRARDIPVHSRLEALLQGPVQLGDEHGAGRPGPPCVSASTQTSSTFRNAPLVIIVCRCVSGSVAGRSTTTLSRLRMKS